MQRYFLNKNTTIITDDDFFHITKVMRMKSGDKIVVCKNEICHITRITVFENYITYEEISEINNSKQYYVTLIQGNPKGSKLDIVLKYGTMFGVDHFIALEMKRSIAKINNIINKEKRFQSILKESASLAHANKIPTLSFETEINEIDFSSYDLVLLADEEENTSTLKSFQTVIQTALNIAIVIGPEGGIDTIERSFLQKQSAKLVTLGTNIMATEIAALHILSYISILKKKE